MEGRLGPEVPVLATSSATGAGLRELAELLLATVPADAPAAETGGVAAGSQRDADVGELAEHMVFRPGGRDRGVSVRRIDEGRFEVSGGGIERLIARHDVDNEDAMAYVEERLRKLGVLRALQDAGFVAGDDVHIAGMAFELDPGAAA